MTRIGARGFVLSALIGVCLAATQPASADAGPSTADVVRLPFPGYAGTLTPYTFGLGYPLMTLVYDTLMWRDASGVPRPWLARSIRRSAGGRRVTVTLRPGVRWHDGRPLTAADVAFTFRFVAAHFHPRFTPQLSDVRRVRARGRLAVVFELRRPSLGFDDQPLSDVPILPRHVWRNLPSGQLAPRTPTIGSGPYRLVHASPKTGYVFRADRHYTRGVPRVREIRVPIIREARRTFEALRGRRVDMVPLSLPRQVREQFESTSGIVVRRGPSYAGTALELNLRRPPFDRPVVRRAIAAALNLQRIVRAVAPATPAVTGHVHPASGWSRATSLQRFNLARARATLTRLGGAPIRVLAPGNDPVRLEAGRQVVLSLRRAGAAATLVEAPRAKLGRAFGEDASRPDFDVAIRSIPALASQDPEYLTALFGSPARSAPLNVSGYRSAAFDALARRAATAPDQRRRLAATGAELRQLARDVPAIALFFSDGAFAYRPAIYDGWVFVKGTGILDKRSFLAHSSPAAQTVPADDALPASSRSGRGISLLDVLSIVALGGVALLAGAALVQWRRRRY
ncbi:MAG: hypothetical protein H0W96_07470 [Solirubrobacterales bacterium]|nr:hypothetical protein [Solirubrobacterales bacterium]